MTLEYFAKLNENTSFRNSLTRRTSIALTCIYAVAKSETAARMDRSVGRTSTNKRFGGQQNQGSQQISRRLSIANNVLRFSLNLREAAKIRIYFAN